MNTININKDAIATKPKIIKQYFHVETGVLHNVEDVRTFESGFQVRYFTIMSEGYKPEPIKFKLTAEDVALIEGFIAGSKMEVVFRLRGREWQGQYFVDLEAKSLEILEETLANTNFKENNEVFADATLEENIPF